jgi:DnaK suppressor protein
MPTTMSPRPTPRTPRRRPKATTAPAVPWDRFEQALREQRDAQLAQVAAIDGTAFVLNRLAGDEAVMLAQLDATRRLLVETEQALARIDAGTFGTCQRCSTDIPQARLEILPHARYCVACQQHLDRRAD